jgi:hypothetical protein
MLKGWKLSRDADGFYASRQISFWQRQYFLKRGCQIRSFNGSYTALKIDWYDLSPL